ncbi:recombination protein Rad52, partial [Metschnikowia bicuspidata]
PVPYTPEEQQSIQEKLDKVLGPEYVSTRPGGSGQSVAYIEGWKVLNLANEIFGFNGWSSELVSVNVDFVDTLGAGRVSLGLSVVVRITLRDGTFHEDLGYGFLENARSKAVAFEKCKKEAFTDALKRCLRCFGNVLGNCLYDKTLVAKTQKVRLPPPELTSTDFHRDPMLMKQEVARQRMRGATTRARPLTPVELRKYDLDQFDDLFVFSDDLAADADESNVDFDMKVEDASAASAAPDVSFPAQVFFTSSKKALDLQKTPKKSDVPVFDHKFVAEGVKRTVDPMRSAKVRRADLPSPYTPSQINAVSVGAGALGKRPLGLPPSQRTQSKRL